MVFRAFHKRKHNLFWKEVLLMSKIDPKNADELLKVVSKKLNVPLNNMSSSESAKFKQVMNNPKLVEKIISTPQAQALYKKITGEK